MDRSKSPEESLEHDTFVREYLHRHHKAKSWDADHSRVDHEREHHSDNEVEQSQRSSRQRRRRLDGGHEGPDPFHSSNQRIWESKHKRQDHRRHLRRSVWHPSGKMAGSPAEGAQVPRDRDPHAHLRAGVVDRLFSCDSSDEERLAAEREYRMMKRRRDSVQELLDLRKLRDLCDKEDRNMVASFPEPKRFKGWKERIVHAEKVNHSKHESDHGYYRELYYALKADQPGSHERKAVYGDSFEDGEVSSSFLWPPILLVNNAGAHKVAESGPEVTGKLKEVRAVYDGKQDTPNVVVYPATEVGFVNAKLLDKKLIACSEDPENLMKLDYRRYRTLRDPLDDDGKSSSDDSAYSRRELQLPGDRSKRASEHAVRLIKRKEGGHKTLHWRLKDPTKWVEEDPVKGLCDKWSHNFRLSQDPPPVETHPWTLTEKQRQADKRFKEQLQQARLQSPATKKKVKGELKVIETEMRKNNLLWLQDVDAVRERFCSLTDDIKEFESRKELDREINAMQIEQAYEEEMDEAEQEMARQNAERFDRDLYFLQNQKRAESKIESQALVNEWVAEEKVLAAEVAEARRTKRQMRRRLQQKLFERREQHMANLGHLMDSDISHHSDYLNVDEQPDEVVDLVKDVKRFDPCAEKKPSL